MNLAILGVQILLLPWLSGVLAAELPAEAHMRWPILTLAILGLLCVQVGIVCTLRLLGFTRRGEVFSPAARRWVDAIVWAFLGEQTQAAALNHMVVSGGTVSVTDAGCSACGSLASTAVRRKPWGSPESW